MAAPPGASSESVAVDRPSIARLQRVALDWYEAHGRDLAFRRTSDPWAVLVSEVMAQQTQAERAATAWQAFIARYPTPASFAAVSPAEAIRAWRGLGYNRRAIALREAAIRIVERHGGCVPKQPEALQALPGIGPYTARAVLAIAFGRPVAALDTNIVRVVERSLGELPAAARERQSFADSLVPADRPAEWTHALMDIGATLCRARETRCDACPLRSECSTARRGLPAVAAGRPARTAPSRVRFPATTRWLRGRILDLLRDARDGSWVDLDRPIGDHDRLAVRKAVGRLDAEGLLETRQGLPEHARLRSH